MLFREVTPARRHFIAAASCLAHLVLLGALLLAPPPAPRAEPEAGFATVFLELAPVAGAGSASPRSRSKPELEVRKEDLPPRPPPPMEVEPIYADVETAAQTAETTPEELAADAALAQAVAAAAGEASGSACNLADWLQTALRDDARVQTALAALPVNTRSVAGAIMLWDGDWTPAPQGGQVGIAVLRSAVLAGLAAAPPACLAETMRGPALLAIPEPRGATVLAVGSGEWRWQDLATGQAPRHETANTSMPYNWLNRGKNTRVP